MNVAKSTLIFLITLISSSGFTSAKDCSSALYKGDRHSLQADTLKASKNYKDAAKAYQQAASHYKRAIQQCKDQNLQKAKTSFAGVKKCASDSLKK